MWGAACSLAAMWGEIPLGKPFGIELRLHVLFFVTLLLAVISQAWVGPYYVAWAVVLAGPVLLVTIYLHELGHCLASKMVSVLSPHPYGCKASLLAFNTS